MSRINEKVKDLIEVRSYTSLLDFGADPGDTLGGYHFTDITSQLMATWLDALVDLQSSRKNAKALAGYRGVGKSHFLAAFGGIVGHPELRSGIQDAHVAASAHHLMRRRYPVAVVKRGLKPTLVEEIRVALSLALEAPVEEFPTEISAMMEHADQLHSDVPLVIIIDTALERESRVSRGDGVILGELAEAVLEKNILVGLALDDDITDADGINAAIARSYTIDYLDQEHLYRIVDSHIFPKHRQSQALIQDIYHQFRGLLPAFRWSEQRFSSLYPLHPVILEISPFVRLYAPEFALLGFASEAGARIMGRPANSLIALDEVFDKVEDTLRKSPDLKESFATYDAINEKVVSLIPVMQRLQAKLILKALFVLSLDGDGTTAGEIAAAMLIYDESDAEKSESGVAQLLETFVSVFPEDLHRKEEGGEVRFSFKVSRKDDLNLELAEAVNQVSEDVVPRLLSKVAKDRFPDWNLSLTDDESCATWTDSQVVWRGGQRRTRISWNWGSFSNSNTPAQKGGLDLEVSIVDPGQTAAQLPTAVSGFEWRPAPLTQDEIDTIRRYHLLLTDENLKEKYHEQVRAAGHTHSVNIGALWDRVFVSDAVLVASDGTEHPFPEAANSADTVGELIGFCLEGAFETSYPDHPRLGGRIEMKHVSTLVNDLFSGVRVANDDAQLLARLYALPLGLVSRQGDNYLLDKEDAILGLPFVEAILGLLQDNEEGSISLRDISEKLKAPPFGFVKEAQQLVLGALVALRKIEFVTSKGDRINRRSLDLKIIWDDISGIAKPVTTNYPSKRLSEWAGKITRIEEPISIDNSKQRVQIKDALTAWLTDWQELDLLSRFAAVPDEILNTKIWQISVNVERAFLNVAEAIGAFCDDTVSLEEALERIADSFSNSDSEFDVREKELVALVSFIKSASLRESIWAYLAVCEITRDDKIEEMRRSILDLMENGYNDPNVETNKEISNLWKDFHSAYADYFAIKHDSIMKSHQLQEKFDEFTKSDEWWEFESLSKMPPFQNVHWKEAQSILAQLRELDCSFDVRELVKSHPFCACSFNLSRISEWEQLPDRLADLVAAARASYRKTLKLIKPDLISRLEQFLKDEPDQEFAKLAVELKGLFEKDKNVEMFSTGQLIILHKVLNTGQPSKMVVTELPDKSGVHTAAGLSASLGEWLNTLPAEPVQLRIN